MSTDKRLVHVLLDEALLKKLDDFRFKHRFESRTEATRWLLRAALEQGLRPPAVRE